LFRGNINAVVIAIAKKAADILLGGAVNERDDRRQQSHTVTRAGTAEWALWRARKKGSS